LPPLLLAVALLVPSSTDPRSNYAEAASNVASAPARWQAGYYLFAVAMGLAMLAVSAYSSVMRRSGSSVAAIVPLIFVLAGCLVIVAGQGAIGLGAALTERNDGPVEDYLAFVSDDNPVSLIAFVASLLQAVCLLALGVVTWRSRTTAGRWRFVSSAGFILSGGLFALTSGWVVEAALFMLPFSTAAAMWPWAVDEMKGWFRADARPHSLTLSAQQK
jgi:hypothetical protein